MTKFQKFINCLDLLRTGSTSRARQLMGSPLFLRVSSLESIMVCFYLL